MKPTSSDFDIKDVFPVTSLSWLPTTTAYSKDFKLLGSFLDTGIVHWDPNMKKNGYSW